MTAEGGPVQVLMIVFDPDAECEGQATEGLESRGCGADPRAGSAGPLQAARG